jgi:cobalamin biosynthesis protein CobT
MVMKKQKIIIGGVVILLIGGGVWAWMSRPDPQMEKVKQMGAELFAGNKTPEQRRQQFELIRQEAEKLTPSQQQELRELGRQQFERRMDQQIAKYFAMPPAERTAYLDKQIQEQEKRRKEWESRRPQSNASGGQGGGGPPGNAGGPRPQNNNADERAQRRGQWMDNSTAQQRSMRSSYMADMRKRRIELGLPAMPPFGPRPR